MTAGRLRAAFIAATVAWAVLLVAAPLLASRAHASPVASAVIIGVYALGTLVCHQLPSRSYHLWTAQMPVCARCAGIYFGAVAGAIAGTLRAAGAARYTGTNLAQGRPPALHDAEARRSAEHGVGRSAGRVRAALALAVTPTVLTLVYEWTTGVMPAHAVRAAAGVPIGLVVAWLVVAAAENQVN